jgi:hypothetical protein
MPAFDPNTKWRRSGLIAAGLMTLLAAIFHLFFFSQAGGLWRDEVSLINLGTRSPFRDMTRDSFPILMPLLIKAWSGIGLAQNDSGLRCLGVMIGSGLLGALWLAARGTTQGPPLLGLALFGINSSVIAHGDALRAYGLGSLWIVLTAAAIWRLVKEPTGKNAIWAGLFAVLSVQTLYQNTVLLAGICGAGALICGRRKAWRTAAMLLGIGAVAALSLLPYIPSVLAVREGSVALRSGVSSSGVLRNLTLALGFPLPQYIYVWAFLALVVVAGGLTLIYQRPNAPGSDNVKSNRSAQDIGRDLRLFAASALGLSVLAFAGFIWVAALPTQPWYFLPVMALAAFCFDAGCPPLHLKLRAPLLGLVAGTVCISIPYASQDLGRRFTNVDLLAHQLTAEADPQDFVIVGQWYCGITFDRYFKGAAAWTTLPPLTDHCTHRYDLVQAQMRSQAPLEPVFEQVAAALQAGHRVWIVGRMHIPSRDSPAPAPIPAVAGPLPVSASPYIRGWNAQLAHFLNEHAKEFELMKTPAVGWVNPNEDMQLFCARGWHSTP